MNSKKKITIISILIALILVVTTTSITYAIWSSKHVTNSNIVQSGCLSIQYNDITSQIDARRVGPGYEDKYIFSVKNNCSTDLNYQVNIETLEGTTLDLSNIYLSIEGYNAHNNIVTNKDEFDNFYYNIYDYDNDYLCWKYEELTKYEEVTPSLTNAIYSNSINKGVIKTNETHIYKINAEFKWDLDNDVGEDESWYSKITVTSVPQKQIKVTLDPNGGELDNKYLYFSENDNYGELPKPTKDGQVFIGWYYNDITRVDNYSDFQYQHDHTLKAKYLNSNEVSVLTPYAFNNISIDIPNGLSNFDELCIDKIMPYEGNPSAETLTSAKIISDEGVNTYAWKENRTLYYWSSADKIMMQRDKFHGNDTSGSRSLYKTLTSLDLSKIDTSMVTDMSYMFEGLWNVVELDISSFDTSNVTDMSHMFEGCHGLTSLDLSHFNTSKVTDMSKMFWWNYGFTSLNLSSFDTSNVRNMEDMFYEIPYLSSLDLSNFNTSKVENMNSMFRMLKSIETLDLSNFNTTNVKDMYGMFKDSINLKVLNLTGFDLTNVENMAYMFENAPSLTTVTFNGKVYDYVNDYAMLCEANNDLEIIGYTPTERAYGCGL